MDLLLVLEKNRNVFIFSVRTYFEVVGSYEMILKKSIRIVNETSNLTSKMVANFVIRR